jgi:rare lipoprotein A (peptidoglycan hydrolase)
VRITDRLPSRKTLVDLTRSAAAELDMIQSGRVRVSLQVLEPPASADAQK